MLVILQIHLLFSPFNTFTALVSPEAMSKASPSSSVVIETKRSFIARITEPFDQDLRPESFYAWKCDMLGYAMGHGPEYYGLLTEEQKVDKNSGTGPLGQKNAELFALIQCNLSSGTKSKYNYQVEIGNGQGFWRKLCEVNELNTGVVELSLRKEILQLRVKSATAGDLVKFLDRITGCYARLGVALQKSVPDEEKVSILEHGIGSHKRFLELRAWLTMKSPAPKFDEAVLHFRRFAISMKYSGKDDDDDDTDDPDHDVLSPNEHWAREVRYHKMIKQQQLQRAMVLQRRGQQEGPVKCHNCGGLNHIKRHCMANKGWHKNDDDEKEEETGAASGPAKPVQRASSGSKPTLKFKL